LRIIFGIIRLPDYNDVQECIEIFIDYCNNFTNYAKSSSIGFGYTIDISTNKDKFLQYDYVYVGKDTE